MPFTLTAVSAAAPLQNYLDREEPAYQWTVRDAQERDGVTLHTLELTSQTWHELVWRHQLVIAVPNRTDNAESALLFISGGSNDEETGEPNWRDLNRSEIAIISQVAKASGALAAALYNVPRQPILGGLFEDAAISLTFQRYLDEGDETQPLLFPMVKSAIKAMDAIQEFSEEELGAKVERFVVSGASKRGWTTWMTGASDERVAAIAPMVIDMLNWDKHIDYHLVSFGDYSPMIRDYTEKGLQEWLDTEEGKRLQAMVDPYSYLDRYTMPTLIMMGTNDSYWPTDAVKFYFDDLPAEKKFIHYTANADHDLGGGEHAAKSLAGFFAAVAKGVDHPSFSWNVKQDADGVLMTLAPSQTIQGGRIWYTTSNDRDFRNNFWRARNLRTGDLIDTRGIQIPTPESGFLAFYIEVDFPSPAGGVYNKSTRIYILDRNGMID